MYIYGLTLTLGTRSKDSNIISLISRTSISKYNKLIIISSGSSIDTNLDIIIIKIENASISRASRDSLFLTSSTLSRNSILIFLLSSNILTRVIVRSTNSRGFYQILNYFFRFFYKGNLLFYTFILNI